MKKSKCIRKFFMEKCHHIKSCTWSDNLKRRCFSSVSWRRNKLRSRIGLQGKLEGMLYFIKRKVKRLRVLKADKDPSKAEPNRPTPSGTTNSAVDTMSWEAVTTPTQTRPQTTPKTPPWASAATSQANPSTTKGHKKVTWTPICRASTSRMFWPLIKMQISRITRGNRPYSKQFKQKAV